MYSNKVLALAYSCIYYINKETFLLAFKASFKKVFTIKNIYVGFKGARLVLYNLEAILVKLNIYLYILILLEPSNIT